ncbi:GNAT family N-acetyltransferase [Streptacidiphilus sp. P02-A3a]|uniref:GNAT family N-acetyltransferase n=1 Tax=Streptacidiphilus sp. P02-A3a TaxID=2704468 RepID=UPI0015FDA7C2|nr:GNAT family N-acetyltransferase [Streptacidiphilus sp. P02-A3a]QMU73082.1 GNAT family N-acetyltransferase [Streptacidiphilus sp. P02-A3a]
MATGTTPSGGDGIEIRVVEDAELADWGKALASGFMHGKGDGNADSVRRAVDPGRALGAVHRGRFVGTFRSLDREITLPGGTALGANAVTNVTVSATHRRRGLLTAMMTRDLAAAAERGSAIAVLIAAEYRIYGRYGFGPATARRGYSIDALRAGNVRVPAEAEGGSFELLTMDEWRKIGPEVHDRFRRNQPGAINRRPLEWQYRTGAERNPDDGWKEPLVALYRDPEDRPAGLLAYEAEDPWTNMLAKSKVRVRDHIAVDQAASAALWRYALSIDWIDRLEIPTIAPDDPLPLLLDDPRACVDNGDSCADFMWLRVLDAPTAFSARGYAAPGRVVLQVSDRMGYVDGRFAIEAAADGTGRCTAVGPDQPADVAMDASVLGTLCLSSEPVPRLHAAGLLTELRPGGVPRLAALLHTDFRPWCPDSF